MRAAGAPTVAAPDPRTAPPAPSANGADPVYAFEEFRLSPGRCLLTYRDRPVVLGSRAIGILTAMVERPQELIGKDELLAAVWPGVFVHESNIKVNVSGLRRALREVSGRDDFIKTVPGRGYIFAAAVARGDGSPRKLPTASIPCPLPPVDPIFGREADLEKVRRSVEMHRTTTIVGAGGVGKTTVARLVACAGKDAFPDGVYHADLSKVHDGRFVAQALAAAIGFVTIGTDALHEIATGLASRRVLLVLDSCEHVLTPTSAAVDRLLDSTAHLTVLATSREPLRCKGESVLRLEPLPVPDPDTCGSLQHALSFAATEMLIARAFAKGAAELSDADSPALTRIAAGLDGLPLAIELAAAAVARLGLPAVESMLSRRCDLLRDLTGNAPPRHVTLGAALDWSYGLLSPTGAAALRAISLFRGEFDMSAAVDIVKCTGLAAIDVAGCLHELCSKSLVHQRYDEGDIRYRLLDSTRAFGMSLLDLHGERALVSRCHADYVLKRLLATEARSRSGRESYAALAGCVHDVRAALAWALESEEEALLGIRLAVAALPFWVELSLLAECRETSERALARLDAMPAPDRRMRARLLLGVAIAGAYLPEDADLCLSTWETAVQAARTTDDAELLAQALSGCTRSEILAGRHADAFRHIDELRAVASLLEDGWARDEGDLLLAMGEIFTAQYARACGRLEKLAEGQAPNRLPFRRGVQQVAPRLQLAVSFANALWLTGAPLRADEVVDAAVRDAQETGHPLSQCHVLTMGTVTIALWNGHAGRASRYAAELAGVVTRHGLAALEPVSQCLSVLAARAAGKPAPAEDLVRVSDALIAVPSWRIRPVYLVLIAEALVASGRLFEAAISIDRAWERVQASQREEWLVPELLRVGAAMADGAGDWRTAEQLLLQSLAMADTSGAVGWSLRSALGLARLWWNDGRESEAAGVLAPVLARVADGAGTRDFDEARELLSQLSRAGRIDRHHRSRCATAMPIHPTT